MNNLEEHLVHTAQDDDVLTGIICCAKQDLVFAEKLCDKLQLDSSLKYKVCYLSGQFSEQCKAAKVLVPILSPSLFEQTPSDEGKLELTKEGKAAREVVQLAYDLKMSAVPVRLNLPTARTLDPFMSSW